MNYGIERKLRAGTLRLIAGVDEAGRGPLAGPVVAAAVIFPPEVFIAGVNDSKALTPERREELFPVITLAAEGIGIGIVDHETIDEINILQATLLAMKIAVGKLKPVPDHCVVDGTMLPGIRMPATPMVGGDRACFSVAAASIVAKVTRDRLMQELDREFPQYGFARHKGYGTREHMAALRKFGPSPVHRKSFRMPGKEDENG
jgi:ribonuclease HII